VALESSCPCSSQSHSRPQLTFSTTFLRLAITLDLSLALYARPEIRPRTAVQGCVLGPLCADHGSRRHSGDHRRGFPQVNPSIVGLAGLEPGTSSLSGIFARCVQAARGLGGQVVADMSVTAVVRSVPWLSARYGTRVARPMLDWELPTGGRQPGHQGDRRAVRSVTGMRYGARYRRSTWEEGASC
jgi:hypothetical protein